MPSSSSSPASSKNFFTDNDDLRFHLARADWRTLLPLTEGIFADEDALQDPEEARAVYEEALTTLGAFIAAEIAPFARELDGEHPVLVDGEVADPPRMARVMAGLRDMGAMGLTLPRRFGGMNCPMLVSSALTEMLARADTSVVGHFGFHGGIAQALLVYSLEEGSFQAENGRVTSTRFDRPIEAMAAGREWGAMVLTEPGAGSDLAQIKSRAVPVDANARDGEGRAFRLSGQKIFITSGHGEHHIVLARSEDESTHGGLRGLSLFYVPAHVDARGQACAKDTPGARRNFTIGNVEHKMGQHSCVAATIHYDDSHAELIGTRGQGFRGMLLLMNNARIVVGFEAVGIMEAAYRMASAYAAERTTMGKPIAQHEIIADLLDEMDCTIRALRALCFEAAFHEEVSIRLQTIERLRPSTSMPAQKANATRIAAHKRRARHITPLLKFMGGEECVRFTRNAMQILGGIGYVVETGAEKLLRDALVIPVYEGTSQIQALMVLKDNLQAALRNPARFVGDMARARLDSLSAKDPLERGQARLRSLAYNAMQTILTRIAVDKLGELRGLSLLNWHAPDQVAALFRTWNPQKDFSFGLRHAERLARLLAHAAMGEALVRQATSTKGTPAYEERRDLALRFLARFEPKSQGLLLEIEASGGSFVERMRQRRRKDGVEAA